MEAITRPSRRLGRQWHGAMRCRRQPLERLCLAVALCAVTACEPSIEDQVAELARGGADNDTRQTLLLAKERAVDPLLEALASQPDPGARRDIARVLLSLMMRIEDERIEVALLGLLADDPDAGVRAEVARQLGLLRRSDAVPGLVACLDHDSAQVRREALLALGRLKSRWDERADEIHARTRELARDADMDVRVEALVLLSGHIAERLQEASQVALTGDLAQAESLLVATLDFVPGYQRAGYALGRHYLDNGEVERGLQVLRDHGTALDVPALDSSPQVDGRVTEAEWHEAAHIDSFWQLSHDHDAALPTERRTDLYVGYRPEGLYLGMICWDDSTDQLLVGVQHDDDNRHNSWREDRVEIFMDPEMSWNQPGVFTVCDSRGLDEVAHGPRPGWSVTS